MNRTLRSTLAVAFLAAFYLFALLAVAGLAFLVVRVVVRVVSQDSSDLPLAVAAGVLLVLALGAAAAVSTALRRPPPTAVGLDLPQAAHPALWAEVAEIAELVGTSAPDDIRLVPEPTVTVTEDIGRLGLVAGERHLAIGVPLLLTMSCGQVRGLVAHELAHQRSGFLGLAATAYRGQQALGLLASRQGGHSPVGYLMRACARAYLRIARPVSRAQELEADEVAADVAGPPTMSSALIGLSYVGEAWEQYTEGYAFSAAGLRPMRLFEGFEEMWADPRVQARLAAGRDAEAASPPDSPYDAHLDVRDRVARLRDRPSTVVPDETPARQMLRRAGWEAIELERSMFFHGDLREARWTEIADVSARHELLEKTARLPERLENCVLALTRARSRVMFGAAMPGRPGDDEVRLTAIDQVTAAIQTALLQRGAVQVVPDWATRWLLVDETGRSVDASLGEAVEAAFGDEAGQRAVVDFLRDEGIADFRASLDTGRTRPTPLAYRAASH